jgi:CheY-like chemotaxis protein
LSMTPKAIAPVPVKKRILEVSDDKCVREVTVAICERQGFNVIQTSHGDDAFKLYRECGPFALVLTDLYFYDRVPEAPLDSNTIRDGIQLALAIRRLIPDQKIVIHTGSRTLRGQILKTLPQVPILQKPYSVRELESVLKSL